LIRDDEAEARFGLRRIVRIVEPEVVGQGLGHLRHFIAVVPNI
jgi:hypothetical protein